MDNNTLFSNNTSENLERIDSSQTRISRERTERTQINTDLDQERVYNMIYQLK